MKHKNRKLNHHFSNVEIKQMDEPNDPTRGGYT